MNHETYAKTSDDMWWVCCPHCGCGVTDDGFYSAKAAEAWVQRNARLGINCPDCSAPLVIEMTGDDQGDYATLIVDPGEEPFGLGDPDYDRTSVSERRELLDRHMRQLGINR